MKYIFSTLILCFAHNTLLAQYKCPEDSIMTIKGKWKKGKYANMQKDKNLSQITRRIEKISSLFQQMYPQPVGAVAEWFGAMTGTPLVDNGPTSYYFSSLYKEWYCNKNVNKMMLGDETGNWGEVFINHLGSFFHQKATLQEVKINNEDVYILTEPTEIWKGYPLYDEEYEFYGSRTIIVTHNNRLPWRSITQQEYLTSLKAIWQKNKDYGAKGYAVQIADLKKSIKEWQDDKDIKPADKMEILALFQKRIADYKKNEPEYVEQITSECAKKIAVIDNYILQNKEELGKPAILNIEETGMHNFKEGFSEIKKGGNMLVALDPDYFNKSLPDYVPQLMLLQWRWRKSNPGIYYQKQIEENFPIEKLQEMIDK